MRLERRVGSRDGAVVSGANDGDLLEDVTLETGNGVGEEEDTSESGTTPESQDRAPRKQKKTTVRLGFWLDLAWRICTYHFRVLAMVKLRRWGTGL